MKKKIILILSICALLILMFAISASATNVLYIEECDDHGDSQSAPAFNSVLFSSQNELGFSIDYNQGSCHDEYYLFNQEAFIEYVNGRSYDVFHKSSEDAYAEGLTGDFANLHCQLSEEAFNYFVNYVSLTQEDLTAEYNKGFEEGKLLGYEEGKYDAEAAAKAEDDEESSFSIGAVISAILILCPVGLVTALIISKRRKTRR